MKYTLTLAADPAKAPAPGSPEEGRFFQAFFAFNQEIEDKGVYLGGEPLQDISTATTIRVIDGQVSATDGPLPRPRSRSPGATCWSVPIWMRPLAGRPRRRPRRWAMARSRSGPALTTPRPWGEVPELVARLRRRRQRPPTGSARLTCQTDPPVWRRQPTMAPFPAPARHRFAGAQRFFLSGGVQSLGGPRGHLRARLELRIQRDGQRLPLPGNPSVRTVEGDLPEDGMTKDGGSWVMRGGPLFWSLSWDEWCNKGLEGPTLQLSAPNGQRLRIGGPDPATNASPSPAFGGCQDRGQPSRLAPGPERVGDGRR